MTGKDARVLGDDPGKISDDDYDEQMERKYDDEAYHEIMEDFSDTESYRIDEIEGEIEALSRDISIESFVSLDAERARFHSFADPLEAYEDGGGPEVDAREEKVQAVLDANKPAPGDAAQEKKSEWNTKRYLILLGIIVVGSVGIYYTAASRAASNKSDEDVPLPEDVKANIRALVQAWQGKPDAEFWHSLITYSDKNPCTPADFVFFMQYTMDLSPLTVPFLWASSADPDQLAAPLANAYRSQGNKASAILGSLAELRYNGAPTPRYIQAFIGRTVFAELIARNAMRKLRTQPRPATPRFVLHADGPLGEVGYWAAHKAAKTGTALRLRARATAADDLPRIIPIHSWEGAQSASRVPLALLPDEQLKASRLVTLAEPWRGLPGGTPARLIRTDRATLLAPMNRRLAPMAANEETGDALLQFTATAAFALPEPYGPLASGVISLFSNLFGGGGNEAGAFAEAMEQLINEVLIQVQMMFWYQTLKDAASWIQTAVQWLHDKVQTVHDLGGQDTTLVEAALEKDLLPSLLQSLDADSELAHALQSLWQLGNPPLTPSLSQDGSNASDVYASQVMRENAFHTLAIGVGVYLTYLRMRLQWQAAVETQHPTQSGSVIYDYFDTFRLETNNWAAKLSQRLTELVSDRMTFFVARWIPRAGPSGEFPQGTCDIWDYYYFAETGGAEGHVDFYVQSHNIFDRERQSFLDDVTYPNIDKTFRNEKSMINGFVSAIADWNAKMIPPKPANSAGPDGDLTKWGADAPQGANWVPGASVRYAVRYANPAGHADGEWGAETVISTRAFALVTDLPIDALDLATARHLRRQFKPAGGDWGSEHIVAIIPDNTTTTYLDNVP